jgi:23S rRNA pseudouridine2605 synthase
VRVKPRKSGAGSLRTLDRVLSKAGVVSRTGARRWIEEGRVKVDGKKVQTPDTWVDARRQRVTVDGRPLRDANKVYLLLYKPKGYLTTSKDPGSRPTIYDLLKDVPERVIPVGRLDLDTSGLLILTNDTAFADYVTSPDSHVPKTYLVKASARLSGEQLSQLRQGIELTDGPARPAGVRRVRDSEKYTYFEISITEGRNRQVRRMVEALGAKVLKLVRTEIAGIGIGDLQIGQWRRLTEREVRRVSMRTDAPALLAR